jgi:hypothetical protein
MKSDVNHHSSIYRSTYYNIKDVRTLEDKLEHTLLIRTDLVHALKQNGCSNCFAILRDIVKKYERSRAKAIQVHNNNPQEVGRLIIEKE